MSSAEHRIETARVRRSPRYGIFIAAGVALGIILTLILTFAFGEPEESPYTEVTYTTTQVFGFVALFCIPIMGALGGLVAALFDRVMSRRTREVRIDVQHVVEAPEGDGSDAPERPQA